MVGSVGACPLRALAPAIGSGVAATSANFLDLAGLELRSLSRQAAFVGSASHSFVNRSVQAWEKANVSTTANLLDITMLLRERSPSW